MAKCPASAFSAPQKNVIHSTDRFICANILAFVTSADPCIRTQVPHSCPPHLHSVDWVECTHNSHGFSGKNTKLSRPFKTRLKVSFKLSSGRVRIYSRKWLQVSGEVAPMSKITWWPAEQKKKKCQIRWAA